MGQEIRTILKLSALSLLGLLAISCAQVGVADVRKTAEVFKGDGSLQCTPDSGVSLDRMAEQLEAAGIEILSSRTTNDGLMRIALCGAGTGRINVYKIDESQTPAARNFGFMLCPPPEESEIGEGKTCPRKG